MGEKCKSWKWTKWMKKYNFKWTYCLSKKEDSKLIFHHFHNFHIFLSHRWKVIAFSTLRPFYFRNVRKTSQRQNKSICILVFKLSLINDSLDEKEETCSIWNSPQQPTNAEAFAKVYLFLFLVSALTKKCIGNWILRNLKKILFQK